MAEAPRRASACSPCLPVRLVLGLLGLVGLVALRQCGQNLVQLLVQLVMPAIILSSHNLVQLLVQLVQDATRGNDLVELIVERLLRRRALRDAGCVKSQKNAGAWAGMAEQGSAAQGGSGQS